MNSGRKEPLDIVPCDLFRPNAPQVCICGFGPSAHPPISANLAVHGDPKYKLFLMVLRQLERVELEHRAAQALFELYLRDTATPVPTQINTGEDINVVDEVERFFKSLEDGDEDL